MNGVKSDDHSIGHFVIAGMKEIGVRDTMQRVVRHGHSMILPVVLGADDGRRRLKTPKLLSGGCKGGNTEIEMNSRFHGFQNLFSDNCWNDTPGIPHE